MVAYLSNPASAAIARAFSRMAAEIDPTPEEREQARKSHNYLREVLSQIEAADDGFPWLLGNGFLSGSFRRGTMPRPLNDVDLLATLDGTGLFLASGGMFEPVTVDGSGQVGGPASAKLLDAAHNLSSVRILSLFRTALQARYPASQVTRDGQAVNVWLESYGLGIDVVPAFRIIPTYGGEDFFVIPKGGNDPGWLKTNPKRDHEIILQHDRSAHHGERLRPLIRVIKYWNRLQARGRLRSYHLEVIVWRMFEWVSIASYSDALRYFFDHAAAFVGTPCYDPTGYGQNLDQYLSSETRNAAIENIRQARDRANLAYAEELLGNSVASLDAWIAVFSR